ncbi:chitin-binding protein [Streptomyces lunaelactis]|uniref:Chitin-binding protein n=1 Tax=Streptomyces lunaelactis TaxID=1535768 RepID=A0A2R4TDT5_9ACTN|nr:lytic polysaccharide monooxygenase [Streptomyces lunaelactis]AVZ77298.1 chitin-binding protein [Streptomyces lunaelactis]NUK06318.1 lytic polysaccharide monooxygenase [Streptomyces lunaelactis]NUK16130.1 lytic polysaccharide monooxygenase [Streptomyces lunaelactis]NUK55582.1 lytic polysaccharide monooxygenase [Streptomyces lunaelactis]NUK69158.1 lytic polysaccharide monooxygenase [Streptomyces lunaelactis]
MTARRKVTSVAALGFAPFALAGLAAAPAVAHGSMTDPVSRVSACYAEGPESPRSAACKAAVAASGAQAFYDWNEVNIANAAGNHQQLIPDGKLCSAGRDKYKGLDLPRGDWPSSSLASGNHTFRYKATAPHKGSFELYLTKDGYDPSKPLKWSDLEQKPFAKVTNPTLVNGEYVFDGVVPDKSGRHLVYSIWQRSDSPEAFYTCSDVVFGKDNGGTGGTAPAPTASAPSDEEIADGADESTVDHNGHGGDEHAEHSTAPAAPATPAAEQPADNAPEANGAAAPEAGSENLAETGGDSNTPYIAIGGAAALAVGAAAMFGTVRRKAATTGGRHSR